MDNIAVSVLVLTYNANWDKLKMTLESILQQQDIRFEIVVADDGSQIRWDADIAKLCDAYKFADYTIVNAETNGGTVINLNNAVCRARGMYSKAISPGDMLYDARTLHDWVAYMEQHQGQLSFGDAVYYNSQEDSKVNVLEMKPSPANREIFDGVQNRRSIFVDYLLANDTMLGAAIMMRTDAMKRYLARFVGRVIFAEDFMARVMIFEDQKVLHYPGNVVWYEYGLGISTAKNDKWKSLLFKDFEASNDVIAASETYVDGLAKKYAKYLAKDFKSTALRKVYKCLLFPGVVYWRMKSKNTKNRTAQNVDKSFIEKLV